MQEIELKSESQDFRTKEAYKTLRTNIEFSGENVKVICVTSSVPGEGKSTTSFEIAKSFAMNGKKTLLIDADLRKSVMRSRHRKGKVRYGLTNYLAGKTALEECMCATNIPNFCMIFAGPVPPNPSELLGSARFEKLIEVARRTFDMVIIDCPPLGAVIDAAVVSKQTDGAIIVIKSGEISYRFARKVQEQLEVAGSRILGIVLTQVVVKTSGYYGKYYGKYYGQYYGSAYGSYGEEEK